MKKFYDGGEYFVLSTYQIEAIPLAKKEETKEETGIKLAKIICEDACYLSSEGNGQTALEILRIAGDRMGSEILHFLTIRTHDCSEQACVIRQEALEKGVSSALHQSGYIIREIGYEKYRKHLSDIKKESVWALKKQEIQEYGVQETYKSPPIIETVDWKSIYSSMDGSGCGLCIQIIPALLSEKEQKLVLKNTAFCSQAVDGVVPNMRDCLAAASAERWKYYAKNLPYPFAETNIIILGKAANAALVTARVKQALQESSFNTVTVPEYSTFSIYNQPWKTALSLKAANGMKLGKWTSDEVSKIFQMPFSGDCFTGVEENAFSLLPETDLLPASLTEHSADSFLTGRSIYSSREIFLPKDQLLLHTAVMGKSGTGKTTFLKQLISRFRNSGIPVLIMEPVKREYRDMITNMMETTVFTVERQVTPLLINPFYVPEEVPLGDYRSSLLSAFKAAFSLPDPLPSLFEKAISEAYVQYGWTDISRSSDDDVKIFDMADFVRVFKRIIARSNYSNEVKGNMMSGGAFRLQSLIERCPRTFDTAHSTSVRDLLAGCTILEMGNLEPEQKSLVTALTLISILAYLKATRKSEHLLRNIILIDEAHALLDQGDGATLEEKALNSTMTQLMINIITEIRAYGVGVVFSDQSPSRVGGRMLDNVDNIISFRLSGEEAEMIKAHIGAEADINKVLPMMSEGEFVLKNRFLKSALPMKTVLDSRTLANTHVTDEQIVQSQLKYLAVHAKDYRPYPACENTGCKYCLAKVRENARKIASQIFIERQARMKTPEEVAAHIKKLPDVLSAQLKGESEELLFQKIRCIAVHILRRCSVENDISFGRETVRILLSDLDNALTHLRRY